MIAGTCMNSGKTYAATEMIKQATRAGLARGGGKAFRHCLSARHAEHGGPRRHCHREFSRLRFAFNCRCRGSCPGREDNHCPIERMQSPDLIVIELGDGMLGGYSVETVFDDAELREATAASSFARRIMWARGAGSN